MSCRISHILVTQVTRIEFGLTFANKKNAIGIHYTVKSIIRIALWIKNQIDVNIWSLIARNTLKNQSDVKTVKSTVQTISKWTTKSPHKSGNWLLQNDEINTIYIRNKKNNFYIYKNRKKFFGLLLGWKWAMSNWP